MICLWFNGHIYSKRNFKWVWVKQVMSNSCYKGWSKIICLLSGCAECDYTSSKSTLKHVKFESYLWIVPNFNRPSGNRHWPFSANMPEDGANHKSSCKAEEVANKIVLRTSPVGPPLLPEAGFELPPCRLRVLCGKVEVLCSLWWLAQLLY